MMPALKPFENQFVIFVTVVLMHVRGDRIGIIHNATLISTTNDVWINGTQDQCICTMLETISSIFGFNYFQANQSCQLFYNYTVPSDLQINFNSNYVFLELPSVASNGFTTDAPLTTVSPVSTKIHAFWNFDGNMNDIYSNYNGVPINNVSYCTPGITGYGSALCFNASRNQSVLINSTNNPNISWSSFTFEFWINPYTLVSGDRGMMGQCENLTSNRCLHMTIRNSKARISFMNNSCTGTTTILPNTWYHLGYVYDYNKTSQTIYLNGYVDCHTSTSAPLAIIFSASLTVGVTFPLAPYYFDGIIDQVLMVGWVRNASDILDDATLVAYYSFNDNTLADSGPNTINGTGINLLFLNNTIVFNTTSAYFQASNFVLLSRSNRSYSFSLWINPMQTNGSTILHISENAAGGGNFCMPFLGFDWQGRIHAQSWTSSGSVSLTGPSLAANTWNHIAQTFSTSNGIRLYVNGSLTNATGPCDYPARNNLPIITLGSSLQSNNSSCIDGLIKTDPFFGQMDEFRVYARELNTSDVRLLATR